MDIGVHCSFSGCNALDFLPFACTLCGGCFCLDHRSVFSHNCSKKPVDVHVPVCPLCSKPVSLSSPSQPPDEAVDAHIRKGCARDVRVKVSCAMRTCSTPLLPHLAVQCHLCRKWFCLKHRFESDHACDKMKDTKESTNALSGITSVFSSIGRKEESNNTKGKTVKTIPQQPPKPDAKPNAPSEFKASSKQSDERQPSSVAVSDSALPRRDLSCTQLPSYTPTLCREPLNSSAQSFGKASVLPKDRRTVLVFFPVDSPLRPQFMFFAHSTLVSKVIEQLVKHAKISIDTNLCLFNVTKVKKKKSAAMEVPLINDHTLASCTKDGDSILLEYCPLIPQALVVEKDKGCQIQ